MKAKFAEAAAERDARGLATGEGAAAGRDLAAAEDPVEPDEVE